ncbi:MAG: thermonuclease family protein [Deltaproteobacteria bacterium]|nr:thermonuclease family protein [Deltaproteobacteria bacterium]
MRPRRAGLLADYIPSAAFSAAFVFVLLTAFGFDSSSILSVSQAHAAEPSSARVAWVVDGDTAVLANGERVRYLGIDAPERGEPFYDEAKARNKALVKSRVIRLEVCKETPRDKYGRLLAYVYADGVDVGATLLGEGLARPLVIPPCGLPKAAEFRAAAAMAASKGAGVWSFEGGGAGKARAVVIAPGEAQRRIGEVVTIRGAAARVNRTKKALFIRFGPDGPGAFTAVVFAEGLAAFKSAGIDTSGFKKGMTLSVTGKVRSYEGRAEIIIRTPSQLKGD